ncbi:hypothetical protein Nepgr_006680 [Nepenthes gracilis]|uniref:Uncharacterized protein n=1 Tax=Nepenthes gracilis TaxID=150966 RepID=A0AAD3S5K8_NEPGR|nr:hypothetical protein Nepgr_006680 [Nepenthes gracilis]
MFSGWPSPETEDTPVEVEIVYQWKPIRCLSCKKFGHGTPQCKSQSLEDLKKNTETSKPPGSLSIFSASRHEADSGLNKTEKMSFGNDVCQNFVIGSKRDTADLPLPKATFSCQTPVDTNGMTVDAHSAAVVCSDPLTGVEEHWQPLPGDGLALVGNDYSQTASGIELQCGSCQPGLAPDPVIDATGPRNEDSWVNADHYGAVLGAVSSDRPFEATFEDTPAEVGTRLTPQPSVYADMSPRDSLVEGQLGEAQVAIQDDLISVTLTSCMAVEAKATEVDPMHSLECCPVNNSAQSHVVLDVAEKISEADGAQHFQRESTQLNQRGSSHHYITAPSAAIRRLIHPRQRRERPETELHQLHNSAT